MWSSTGSWILFFQTNLAADQDRDHLPTPWPRFSPKLPGLHWPVSRTRVSSIIAEQAAFWMGRCKRACISLALSTALRLKHCPLCLTKSRVHSSKDRSLSSRPSCPLIFSLYRLGRISFESDTLIDFTVPSASESKNWGWRNQNKTSSSHPHSFPKQEEGKWMGGIFFFFTKSSSIEYNFIH